jgi:metal-responsive CopG/Arc/MetJ family transcriptional regulator
MRTTSMKFPDVLDASIDDEARTLGTTRSAVIREAVEAYLASDRSVTARAGRLVGCLSGPSDLSTSPDHLKEYGS